MKSRHFQRRIPRDWIVLLPICFGPAIVGLVLAYLLPALFRARQGDATLFLFAVASALVGMVLLFLAKLPLYRQGRFFTFGAQVLPTRNRKLYAVAYGFIGLSVCMLFLLLAVVGG